MTEREGRLLTKAVMLLLGGLLGKGAGATTLVPADLGELSRDAGAIVRGRVAAVEPRWTEGRRAIETVVTLTVESTIKGSMTGSAQWTVPGGELGRYRSIVVGAPQFEVGQRVIVLLSWHPPRYPYLVGFSQGVFRVTSAADGSGPVVLAPPPMPSAVEAPVVRGDAARRPVPLAVFEERLRSLAGNRQ